jgi:diguanylate cyclase (GGDEF)-like protein/PAS domain S-box-containing protein
VTEQRQSARLLAESEERYRLLAHNSSDVVFLSRGGVLEWVSPSLARALGWSAHHWIGQHFPDLVHPDDRGTLQAAHDRIRSDHSEVAVVRVRDSEEMDHWITLHIGPFVAASGEFDGIVGSFHVSDDEVAARKELERRAGTDDLTGALIRDEALTRIEQRRRQRRESVALLFIDVDEFKAVNDQRGHAAGDVVLTEIVERMRATVRAEDPIARLGGDEFLVALPGLSDIERALGIAEQIRSSVGEPMDWQGIEVRATVSIGVAIVAPDDSLDAVIARADRAMYEAKRGGRNQVVRA